MDKVSALLFTALRSFLTGEELKSSVSSQDLELVYRLADSHDIAHIVGDVLFKNGVMQDGEPLGEKFKKVQLTALFRHTGQDYASQQIFDLLGEEKITFMPLKGSVIRELYPEPYMRTSCDLDILVPKDKLQSAKECLVSRLGYTVKSENKYHDISLYSPKGVHVELHFSITENMESIDRLLSKVWEYTQNNAKTKYRKDELPEYFVFHHIAHMYHHFVDGGCGIRPFLDLYFIKQKMQYDEDAVLRMCEECNILKFYNEVKHLSDVWFADQKHNEITEIMENYLLSGGVYGTIDNQVAVKRSTDGKGTFLLSRVFLPYDVLKYRYPVLKKNRWLYPVMTVCRWFGVLSPMRRKRAATEIQALRSDSSLGSVSRMMELLDIKSDTE